jgi:ribosomal protein S18 acetylase RimI-like enzyme
MSVAAADLAKCSISDDRKDVTELRFTFLLDSNVVMTLEPHVALPDSEPFDLASRFLRLVNENSHRLTVHAATREDIARDTNLPRLAHRLRVLQKYDLLEDVPISARIADALPVTTPNDRVDAAIASALDANAAHFLVTEDRRLRHRVQSAFPDLADRVVSLAVAVELLDLLHPEPGVPPSPLVELRPCYLIQLTDPIFDSIRADYSPDFDTWYVNHCQLSHRNALVIPAGDDGALAGLCILKDEDDDEYGLPRRRLKLCTLKVAEPYRGERLGELLIKAALDDAIGRHRSGLSITVLDDHSDLIGLLTDLGFENTGERTPMGEIVFFRSIDPPEGAAAALDPFELNRLYGPRVLNANVPMHVIPIQPRWEDRLFPEGRFQLDLLGNYAACGNGIRKAYLSHAKSRRVLRGDIVLFYRSTAARQVRFIAVVEASFASSANLELSRFVGTRTVYTAEEIRDMTENGKREVSAILMRQSRKVEPGWTLKELVEHNVIVRAPQSIQSVPEKGTLWLREQLSE